jgi:transcriptional regulator with XRE-family HTH domain
VAGQSGDPVTDDADSLTRRLGLRLRERRTERGRTLAAVAADAGVSLSYLSAVENGVNQPSLLVLARIVHALDLTIADALRSEGENWVRTSSVTDVDGTRELDHPGLQLRIAAVRAEPGETGTSPLPVGEHDVFVYVLDGAVAVTVDDEEHELRTGDALDARTPRHIAWRALGGAATTALWAAGATRPAGWDAGVEDDPAGRGAR